MVVSVEDESNCRRGVRWLVGNGERENRRKEMTKRRKQIEMVDWALVRRGFDAVSLREETVDLRDGDDVAVVRGSGGSSSGKKTRRKSIPQFSLFDFDVIPILPLSISLYPFSQFYVLCFVCLVAMESSYYRKRKKS